jgi:uncharacterized repeat protein (TIGR03803 family)
MCTRLLTVLRAPAIALCLAVLAVPVASAQNWGLSNLYIFQGMISGPDGGNPYGGVILGSDGNYYGTTWYGGTGGGVVFKVTPSGTESIVYAFSGSRDGQMPFALVQGPNGNLYGGTWYGGQGFGIIYEVTLNGKETILQSLSNTNGGPAYIQGGLTLGSDGNFYGTSAGGGAYGQGTFFRMTPSGELTVLYSFTESSGTNPHGELIETKRGEFYGATAFGGDGGYGTVFMVTTAGELTVLHAFSGGADGGQPWADLVRGNDGAFYGTTQGGGSGKCSNWAVPPGCGTVFRVTSSGEESIVYTFLGYPTDGSWPTGGLTRGKDGIFYGTTTAGGYLAPGNCTSGCGTIFSVTPKGQEMLLYACGEPPNPWYYNCWSPSGTLLLSDGDVLTGTSGQGGGGWGNVFQLAPAPTVTLTTTRSAIELHQSTDLKWASNHAQSCLASGSWSGEEALKGSERETPSGVGSYTYTLTCTGVGATANASATVAVSERRR